MVSRRLTGKKSPPYRPEMLLKALLEAVDHVDQDRPMVIGGKSMGGRIASLPLDDLHGSSTTAAGVCLGYPFHPLSKPAQLRTQHLIDLSAPCLIVQGERDAMGLLDEVEGYPLARR